MGTVEEMAESTDHRQRQGEAGAETLHVWQDRRVVSQYRLRRIRDRVIAVAVLSCLVAVLYPLFDILYIFAYHGALAISIPRLTQTSNPAGAEVGVANAIVGTLLLVAISSLVAVPIGVLGGIYLAEFSAQSRFGNALRFIADVLAGVPSIVLGYIGFLVLIIYFRWGVGTGGGSVLAGSLALAVLMLPYILRTTEISLLKVPRSLREAAIALGSTKTQMINKMTFSLALPSIVTGIILSMSISIGETAPLLYTAYHSDVYPTSLIASPTNYLTYIIWGFATSANTYNLDLAYLSAFLLVLFVVTLNVVARIGLRRFSRIQ